MYRFVERVFKLFPKNLCTTSLKVSGAYFSFPPVIRKLELIEEFQLDLNQQQKVDLLLVRMLPKLRVRFELKRLVSTANLIEEINKMDTYESSLKEQSRV